jgi:hypothetical protein
MFSMFPDKDVKICILQAVITGNREFIECDTLSNGQFTLGKGFAEGNSRQNSHDKKLLGK